MLDGGEVPQFLSAALNPVFTSDGVQPNTVFGIKMDLKSEPKVSPGSYTKYEDYWWLRPHYAKYKYDMKMDLPWEWAKEEEKCLEYQMYPRVNPLTIDQDRKKTWYWYFDTPDNEDCFKKVASVSQWAFLASSVYTIYDSIMLSQPTTASRLLTVAAKNITPFTAAMAMAASVQCAVASLRGNKDDMLSFAAGGASLGLFLGMKTGNSLKGAYYAAWGAIAGVCTKEMNRLGYSLCPPLPTVAQAGQGQWGGQFGGDWTGKAHYHDPGGRRPY